jgi:predicted transcriptional regulator YheO
VQKCLNELNGDVLAVAARLRIGKSTVYRMIQQQELHIS